MIYSVLEEMLDEMEQDQLEISCRTSSATLSLCKFKRLWKAKDEGGTFGFENRIANSVYESGRPQFLTDVELVGFFIESTNHWYTQKRNTYFGREEDVRVFLIRFLEYYDEKLEHTNMQFAVLDHFGWNSELRPMREDLMYVLNKFVREWISSEGIFEIYTERNETNAVSKN